MDTPDPELAELVASLTRIAAEPLQAVARVLELAATELDRDVAAAERERELATTPEAIVGAAMKQASATGGKIALELVAQAIFNGLANGLPQ